MDARTAPGQCADNARPNFSQYSPKPVRPLSGHYLLRIPELINIVTRMHKNLDKEDLKNTSRGSSYAEKAVEFVLIRRIDL